MNWYTIYTKPKQEDKVAEQLVQASLEVFNPKFKRKKLIRGKYETVIHPLFPSYFFAKFNPEHYYHMIKYTRGVRSIVGNPGSPWAVSEDIIALIKSHMNEEGFVTIGQDFKVGDKVEILEGPLKGFIGIFEREMKDRERIIVLLNTIEYQVRVEVERGILKTSG